MNHPDTGAKGKEAKDFPRQQQSAGEGTQDFRTGWTWAQAPDLPRPIATHVHSLACVCTQHPPYRPWGWEAPSGNHLQPGLRVRTTLTLQPWVGGVWHLVGILWSLDI